MMMMIDRAAEASSTHFHAVRFYKNTESLALVVAEFIAQGVATGQPSVLIATSSHSAAIERAIGALGIDIAALRAAHRFTVLDADAVLHEILVDGMPSAERFRAVMTPVIEEAAAKADGQPVRAYGEMVDVLWKAGRTLAATRLEILWNSLHNAHHFALLCGYAMGNFYEDAAIDEICGHHTHVMSASGETAVIA
jgi:MEDS: MEthanogen/methylotroph, DcmR Sensory domain